MSKILFEFLLEANELKKTYGFRQIDQQVNVTALVWFTPSHRSKYASPPNAVALENWTYLFLDLVDGGEIFFFITRQTSMLVRLSIMPDPCRVPPRHDGGDRQSRTRRALPRWPASVRLDQFRGILAKNLLEGRFGQAEGADLLEKGTLAKEGVVGGEKHSVGAADLGHDPKDLEVVEVGRRGRVVHCLAQGVGDLRHQLVEGQAASPVGEHDSEVGMARQAARRRRGDVAFARVAVAQWLADVDDEGQLTSTSASAIGSITEQSSRLISLPVRHQLANAAQSRAKRACHLSQRRGGERLNRREAGEAPGKLALNRRSGNRCACWQRAEVPPAKAQRERAGDAVAIQRDERFLGGDEPRPRIAGRARRSGDRARKESLPLRDDLRRKNVNVRVDDHRHTAWQAT